MKLAIHPPLDQKPNPEDKAAWKSLATNFVDADLTINQLAERIGEGCPFTGQHDGRRSSKNFYTSEVLAVDIDNGMTLEDAKKNPFVQKYAAILYPTQNHTEDHNRFRIVFALTREIQDAEEMKYAYQGITRKFGGDGACTDACRFFFGSRNHQPIVIGKVLPNRLLEEIIALGKKKKVKAESKGRSTGFIAQRSEFGIENNQTVVTATGETCLVADLSPRTAVHCPQHEDKHPSAYVVLSKSGVNGIHCSKCDETFWPKEHLRKTNKFYDFYEIDKDLQEIEFFEDPLNNYGDEAPVEYFSNDGRIVQSSQSQHLAKIFLSPGVTAIRSPKGTGKTHQLKSIVAECKANDLSVLLIGHRQSLVSALCKDLDLGCYLHRAYPCGAAIPISRYFGICLDSLPTILDLKRHKYDVVIIDESEQVFSHLTSDTLKSQRRQCFLMLQRYIERAKTVIACDADLSYLTLGCISIARKDSMPDKVYVNRYKETHRVIDVYQNGNQLLGELLRSVEDGEKCYVCCNSKKQAKDIATMLSERTTREIKQFLITGDTSGSVEAINFVTNIKEKILTFDVVISSPTLGTGIDITFPDFEEKIDCVFGFFQPNINTHFDIDQQLCRVRHPKAVKVWISPQTFSFETEPDAIKRGCVEAGHVIDAQIGYDADDNKTYAEDDDLVALYAEVTSKQRASKNHLKKHFVDLKTYNGWTVNEVLETNADWEIGSDAIAEAKEINEQSYAAAICSANQITTDQYKMLLAEDHLNEAKTYELYRHRLEKFYDTVVSPELVAQDQKGKFRRQIKLMQLYLLPDEVLTKWDHRQSGNVVTDRNAFLTTKKLLREVFLSAKLTDAAGQFDREKLISTKDLTEFKRVCRQREHDILALLDIKPRRDLDEKPIAHLGEFLKAIGCGWAKPIRRDEDGKRTKYYGVDIFKYAATYEYTKKRLNVPTNTTIPIWEKDDSATSTISRLVNKARRRSTRV
jgi:hypothetical protein